MPDAAAIQLQAQPGRGLYESFYFRGASPDGRLAFWLKHNMLRHHGSDEVSLEGALVLFDRERNLTRGVYSRQPLDGARFARMSEVARDWEHVALEVPNGSAVEIGRRHLRGRFVGEGGYGEWDLQLHRGGHSLMHFPHDWMYRAGWPRKKLLTRECQMEFLGRLRVGEVEHGGVWHGMNGHNWGSEHAHSYAYASCASFEREQEAYFDGFSAQVAVRGWTSPWLSMASLWVRGRWHRFNSLLRAPRQQVRRLQDHAWEAHLANGSHRLELEVDGASPETLPWVAMHYEHPDRRRSVVKSTKLAALRLRLVRLDDGSLEDELSSQVCELETLLPRNRPAASGYFGTP